MCSKHALLQEGGEEGLACPQCKLIAVDHLNIGINLQWTGSNTYMYMYVKLKLQQLYISKSVVGMKQLYLLSLSPLFPTLRASGCVRPAWGKAGCLVFL